MAASSTLAASSRSFTVTPADHRPTSRRPRRIPWNCRTAALAYARLQDVHSRATAARELARQVDNVTLGLPSGTELDGRERCNEYGRYLFRQKSAGGQAVADVLKFVLWSDRGHAATRIWDATQKTEWRLPHLGPSILGEMIGYARPDQFPPRKERVIRTLTALGFAGLPLR